MSIKRTVEIIAPYWNFPLIANASILTLCAAEVIELTLVSRGYWPNAENSMVWEALVKLSKKEDKRFAGQKWIFHKDEWQTAEAFFLLGLYFNYEIKITGDQSDLSITSNHRSELIVETTADSLSLIIDSFLSDIGREIM